MKLGLMDDAVSGTSPSAPPQVRPNCGHDLRGAMRRHNYRRIDPATWFKFHPSSHCAVLTPLAKVLLFATSYCPMLPVIVIKDYEALESHLGHAEAMCAVVISLSTVAVLTFTTWIIFGRYERLRGQRSNLHGVTEASEKHVLLYFITCAIPFVTVDTTDPYNIASYLIILALMAFLYVRSGLVYLNPVLALLKLNIYKVSVAGKDAILITRNQSRRDPAAEIITMTEGVYYERQR